MKMLVRSLSVACLLSSLVSAQTPAKRPMTFADLQALKRISDPQISPSGKWVLFSVTDVSLEKNTKVNHLWVVPLAGGKEVQVTSGAGEQNGRFSPDGKWVMLTADEQLQIAPWNDTAGTLAVARKVTSLETGADGGIWAPDSKHFLFVSSVYPECESHAPMGPQRNDEEANCNALKDTVEAKNPVKALVFDHLLYRHWNSFVEAKHSHIFYATVEGGPPTDLTPGSVIGDHEAPTFSLGGPLGYAISPDGHEVAYVTNLDKVPAASTNNDIFTLQIGSEPSTAKKVSTSPGSDDGPAYSPDGRWLAWRSQARNGFESDKFRLMFMDRSNGIITNATPKFDRWVDEFAWSVDSKSFYFVAGNLGQATVFNVHRDGSELKEFNITGEYSDIHVWADTPKMPPGAVLVAGRMSIAEPTKLIVIDLERGVLPLPDGARPWNIPIRYKPSETNAVFGMDFERTLTHLNESVLAQLDLDSGIDGAESFWFPGAENRRVQGFVVRPPNFDPAKKYPVKFLMHGGPQTAWGDAWSYRWNWQLLAANGYVVIGINRRGSTGYGQKFVDEVSGDWGGKAYIDLMKGLDYAEVTYPFIDKTRECALGASYGGFMANWVLTHTDRFKCIVTHDGLYNPQSAYGSTEEVWFNEWEFRPAEKAAQTQIPYGDDNKKRGSAGNGGMVEQTKPAQPWDYFGLTNEADPFRKFSPMLHIQNAHTPTLVIHSQRDYRLDVSEGFQLFTALQRLGVPSKMLYFPDEGHWVLKPRNSQLWYETVNDWCDRWLGMNKYAALGPEKNPMPNRHPR